MSQSATPYATRLPDSNVREPLRVLIVEDNPLDAELMIATLKRSGFDLDYQVVDRESEFLAALDERWDVILSDYDLGEFEGPQALRHCLERDVAAPFLIVSGTIGEERAVDIMRDGAADYLLKDRLTRLGMAIRRAREARRIASHNRRLGTAMEQTGEAVMITTTTGEIVYVNPAFEEITGYPQTAALGQSLALFAQSADHEDGGDPHLETMWRALRRGEGWRGRLTHQRPSGGRTELDLTLSPVRDDDGEIQEFVGVARDIGDQMQLERAFRHAQKMEAVGRLAGGVAHDFNNLLTAIMGYNELLLADAPEGRPRHYLEEIRRATQRGAALTGQLLTFSRQERAWPDRLSLASVVRGCRDMMERLIGEDVTLRVENGDWTPPVQADRSQLEQVIVNLVVNARDAMPDGGTITLTLGKRTLSEAEARSLDLPPGRYSTLQVADTGVGIDPKTRERIFEPFFTTKERGKGTGLGLSTVFGIVREARGGLEVVSAPNRGSQFTILLPAQEEAKSAAGLGEAEPERMPDRCTVLVVEDEEATGRLVQRLLSEDGHRVLLAPDAEEALKTWHRHAGEIDLLLTDVVLPGQPGPELAREVRRQAPGTPVLFMSGYPGRALESASPGEYGYLPKPFTPDDLRQALARTLEN